MQLFEVFGSIGLKDAEFNKSIDAANQKGENFGTKFGNMIAGVGKAAAAGLGIAATAFAGLSIKALKLGGDLEQSVGGIETLFKGASDTVIANAERAYLTAGVNAIDYMNQVTSFSASLLQSLEGDTVAAAAAADMAVIDMADNANKMGTSVEMIQNAYQGFAKQNYTMLDNLKLGFGGTKTEMERLLEEAEKISGIRYDISNLNDVYQAIHVIQTELGITGTTAKEGMETLNGAFATAQAAVNNFLSGAGGVDDAVNAIGNLGNVAMKNLGELLPRLFTGLGVGFTALLNKAGQMAPALKPGADMILFLAKNMRTIMAVVIPLTAAMLAFQAAVAIQGVIATVGAAFGAAQLQLALYSATVGGAITAEALHSGALAAKEILVGVLTGKIGLATAAQWLWNAAITANPIGLAVAAVAGLTAGVVILVGWLNKQNETTQKLNEENEALVASTEALNSTVDSTRTAYDKSTKSMQAETKAAQKLADEVFSLAATENKTAEQKNKLTAQVKILNDSMAGLNLQYDAENDALSKTKEAINGIIAARMEQAKATAAQERAVEIAKEQMLVEEQLNSVADQRIKLEQAKEDGFYKSQNAAKEYAAAIKELDEQEGSLNEQNADLALSFEYVSGVVADSVTTTTDAMERQGLVMEAMTEAQTAALESLAAEYTTYADAATNMFDRISEESKLTFDEMLKNIQENQRIVGEWANNIANLSERGIDEGLMAQLKRMGPEGAGYVAELVRASDEKLGELNEAFRAGGETSVNALSSVWNVDTTVAQAAADLADSSAMALENQLEAADFPGMGKNVAQGLADGINENAKIAVEAAREMARAVAKAAKGAFEIGSPSKLFKREIGAMIPAGTAEGILGGIGQAVNAAKEMASQIFDAASGSVGVGFSAAALSTANGAPPTSDSVGSIGQVNQYFQVVEQSPYEQQQAAKAALQRARW